jgi:hypothetical protein
LLGNIQHTGLQFIVESMLLVHWNICGLISLVHGEGKDSEVSKEKKVKVKASPIYPTWLEVSLRPRRTTN